MSVVLKIHLMKAFGKKKKKSLCTSECDIRNNQPITWNMEHQFDLLLIRESEEE